MRNFIALTTALLMSGLCGYEICDFQEHELAKTWEQTANKWEGTSNKWEKVSRNFEASSNTYRDQANQCLAGWNGFINNVNAQTKSLKEALAK